jgi:hypothetical protein
MTPTEPGASVTVPIESVADVLERELNSVILDWLRLANQQEDLLYIPLSFQARAGHLRALLDGVIARLRLDTTAKAPISKAAGIHGNVRCKQGYTTAMVVEESRLLEVTIFRTLHKNAKHLEFATLLPKIAAIADEVDSQLKQQMLGFAIA